ncbi:MAG: hypothetical protein KIS92_18965 [Planctomycetota bacterium]|nr:hypothetical protein [Planctomycetota bacterium]
MRLFWVVAIALAVVAGSVRAESSDERIKKLEELVKAQAARLEMLEKKEAAAQAKATDIKLDATIQRAIDKAVAANAGTGSKYGGGFLAPDEPDVKGHRLFFTGEYTYTKVQKGDTAYAYRNVPGSLDVLGGGLTGLASGDAENTELDWAHGFRVGMGYRLPYDGWDLYASYQHMDASSETSTKEPDPTAPGFGFLYTPYFSIPFAFTAKAKQDFNYNKVNLEVGRRFKVSKTLSMRVFGGPSIVWFDDTDQFQYWGSSGFIPILPPFDGVTRGAEFKRDTNDFLYGIRFGAEGDFKLGKGVSVYGKAAGSLLTGKQEHRTFRAMDSDILDVADGTFSAAEILQDTKSEFHNVVPAIELAAGVNYERKINENFLLKFSLGYEFSNYFNVIERTDSLILLRGNAQKSDLGMHGFVFKVKLDF